MAQTAHGWAFAWARKLGMFEIPDWTTGDRPDMAMSAEEKYDMWKAWANVESCRRTTLGLFMIDAQLARYNGGLPVGKHVLNPLSCATPDSIFNAATADDWVLEMNRNWKRPPSFRELYLSIFDVESAREMPLKSPFSVAVLLEGIQAVISERSAASGNAVGIPSDHNITQALLNLWTSCLETPNSDVDMLELRLRWHTLCLDLSVDSVQLFRKICDRSSEQNVFCAGQTPLGASEDSTDWTQSVGGRRALLHAVAIQDLAGRLYLGRAYAASTPSTIFAAATVYCAFCHAGQAEIRVPGQVDWRLVYVNSTFEKDVASNISSYRQFLQGDELQSSYKSIHLRHSLYQFQAMLQTISSQWGIAGEMRDLLLPWTLLGTS